MTYVIFNPQMGALINRRSWNPIDSVDTPYTGYRTFVAALEAARSFSEKNILNAKQMLNAKIIDTYGDRIAPTEFHKMPGTRVYAPGDVYLMTKLFVNHLYPDERHRLENFGSAVAELFHSKYTVDHTQYVLRYQNTQTEDTLFEGVNGIYSGNHRSRVLYRKLFPAGFAACSPVWFTGEFLFFATKQDAILFRLADHHSWVGFDLVEIMAKVEKEVKEGLYPG